MARSQSSGLACSFCQKPQPEVRKLIAGPTSYICDECVGLCNAIYAKDDAEVPALAELNGMSLLDFLRQFMDGRAVDSITVGELRNAIAAEREKRLPRPPATPHEDPQPTDPELERLATRYGVPAIDLGDLVKELDRASSPGACFLITGELARRYTVFPVRIANRPERTLIVAMVDPSNEEALRELRLATGMAIAPVVAKEAELGPLIEGIYRRIDAAREQLRQAAVRIAGGERVCDVLPTLHNIPESELTAFLSKQYQVPAIDLDGFESDPDVTALVPEELQRRHVLVPVNRAGVSLIVAMADPSNIYAIDDLKFVTNMNIEVVVASEAQIRRKHDKHFPRPH